MKRIFLSSLPFVLAPGALFADAASQQSQLCGGANVGGGNLNCTPDKGSLTTDSALSSKIGDIVNILLYVAGAVAVIVIIVGGLRYVTSTGDAKRIQQAKDTIFYAIAGLIVAILAYAIVNFVVVHVA